MQADNPWPADWRAHWRVGDDDDHLGLPHAVHSSGLAIRYLYTDVDEDEMAWVPVTVREPLDPVADFAGLRDLHTLYEQARQLWEELGYSDDSPTKRAS